MRKNTASFLGLLFAMILLHITLGYYNVVTKKLFAFYMISNPFLTMWLFCMALILLTVLAAVFFSRLPAKTFAAYFLLLEGLGILIYVILPLTLAIGTAIQWQLPAIFMKLFTFTNELSYTFYLWTALTILHLWQTPRILPTKP